MRLISEEHGVRVYEGNDGFHEVRAYAQAFSFDAGVESFEIDGVRERFEKISIELHTKWLAERNVETFGEIETSWTDIVVSWQEGLVVDDEPVEYFEPFTLKRFTTEQGCWPPAPGDAP